MNERQPSTSRREKDPGLSEYPGTEALSAPSPAIYVASLADYNNGVLHGAWIDAAREPADIEADIKAMLDQSRQPGAEEWAIFDYDQFGRCRVGEHDTIERVAQIGQRIAEHGYAFSAWADLCDYNPERFDKFNDAYLGHYDSVQAYVEEMADDLGYTEELARLPESLQPYVQFDTAALARDMELSGDIQTVDDPAGGVWIFQTNP